MIAFKHLNPAVAVLAGGILLATLGLLLTPWYPAAVVVGPAVLAGGLLLRFPWLGVFLIVAMVPFDAFRGLGGPLQFLTISKLAGVALLGIAALFMAIGRLRLDRVFCNLWPWLLGLAAVGVVSTLFSGHPVVAVDEMRQLVIAYLVLALGLLFIEDDRILDRLTDLVIVSVTISAVLSVAGYLFSIPGLSIGTEEAALKRATGGSADPNAFSSMVLFALPLIVYRLSDPGKRAVKPFYLGALVVCLGGIVLTFSRGGTLVMVITLGLLAWEYRSHITVRRLGLVIFLFSAAAAGAVVSIPEAYWERQASLLSGESDRSLGRRTSYLVVGGRAFLESPVIGHGPGTFPRVYGDSPEAQRFVTSWNPDPKRHAHNTYMEVLIGYGALGLAAFVGFVVTALRNYARAARRLARAGADRLAALVRAHQLSLLTMLIYFGIISQFTVKYLWFWAAISVVALRLGNREEEAGHE